MNATAFLGLGGVLTSAMSGSTIVFGLAAGRGHFNSAPHAVTVGLEAEQPEPGEVSQGTLVRQEQFIFSRVAINLSKSDPPANIPIGPLSRGWSV